ncbi:DUF3658 domain-containing protein [Fictibacillus sp. b24]|uniref:DUF3658 domain-containing protein n=1 Tax=Fictibacillus sp. b24 TaxID=3055863 RepID=UPI00338FAC83
MNEIPNHAEITVWTADNASEQTGIRFVLKLLENRPNPILVVNTNESYDKYCKHPEIYYVSQHTGEIPPKELQVILEKTRNDERISFVYKKQLVKEWESLSNSNEVLRLWENGEIRSVSVNHLDPFIINTARRFEWKYDDEFKKSARLIGDVIGHLEQYVGDEFIQYRLLELINQGIYEYEGNLVGMRNYSVRLAKK